jgi:dTDP-4-amino-4,6-dideoxygalactose transaminase
MKKIPLIKPYINDSVKKMVIEVLDSGHLTEGRITHELEHVFALYVGVPYAIAVTSCTTGMEIALRALNVGEGDEVIVPDYTYPATADVVSIVGATPVIVDVEPKTMLIDRFSVEKAITEKTKAIIPVSIFGNPLDYSWINEIKKKHNLFIIEDSACTIGADVNGK